MLTKTGIHGSIIALDTMNLWISTELETLTKVISRVDMLFVNEAECAQLTGASNFSDAWEFVRDLGPKALVIKREIGRAHV